MSSITHDHDLALRGAIEAALIAGGMIKNHAWPNKMQLKSHPTFGTSSVSDVDIKGQKQIVDYLLTLFPKATFIAEEKGNPKPANYDDELVFSVDSLDGSTEERQELYSWCVGIGVVRRGRHVGGAMFAPEVCGGLLVVHEIGYGTRLWEHGNPIAKQVLVSKEHPKKPVITLGLDVQRTDTYKEFVYALPKELRPRGIAPSGILGLALVAAGRYDAIIQSPQMPWDWIPMRQAVLDGGGAFYSYHLEGGRIVPFADPTPADYDTTKQSLGFVAGQQDLVEEVFDILERTVHPAA